MASFAYKAISSSGRVFHGVYSGATVDEVVDMLHRDGNFPVEVAERKGGALRARRARRASVRDIAVFCRQFYSMLNAGVSIVSCLEILRAQTDNPRLREVVGQMYGDVQKGVALSEAMGKHSRVFPPLLINLVQSGELSGTVDTIMDRTSQYYEKESKLINKIRTAAVYPVILTVVTLALVVFLVTFVMPTFVSMFLESGVPLPVPTIILLGVSKFISTYWYVLIIGVTVLVLAFKRYGQTEEGRTRLDKLKFRLPVLRNLMPKIAAARFSRTMATLLHSGIPVLVALENASAVSGNRLIEEALERTRTEMRRGQPLSVPIEESRVFPPMVHHMIRVGEEAGTLDQLLDKTADYFDEEVENSVQQLATLFEPVMIVTLAVLVGFIIISMMMPIWDMGHTVM